jgi:cobalamin biosynthesis protein CobW
MKIPATVVTGFLGAGKTTLIRHLVQTAAGRRLALIINEFGDLGIDRELLLGCGLAGCGEDDIIELPNGCICCTVADAFLPTMQRLLDGERPAPDHIVIETSGLALPKPLVQAFNWPEVRSRVTVDGVIAVIDAEAVATRAFEGRVTAQASEHERPMQEVFEDQLTCADLVVLNKTDSLSPSAVAALRAELSAKSRPGTKVLSTVRGALDASVALGLAATAEQTIDRIRTHHDAEGEDHEHDEFVTFVAELPSVSDPSEIEARVRAVAVAHDILRIKGFLAVEGKPMRHVVQAVGPRVERYYDRPWRPDERRLSRLVVIAERGIDVAAVSAALASVRS